MGRLADTQDSRHLLVGAGLIEVACTVPLIVVHSVGVIVPLVALLGVATSVSAATWSALVPRIVGEDHVAQAVSAQQSLNAVVLVGAPAVGGLLAGGFGSGLPLAIDAATFAVATGGAALVRTRRRPTGLATDGRPDQARGGFEILRADRVLAPLTVGLGLIVVLVGMVDVVLVFLVRATLHAGGVWYGTIEAAWMAGMVAGSLGGGAAQSRRVQTWATITGAGVACTALVPFALVPAVWMLVPLSILGGIGNGYAGTCYSTLLVSRTPDASRGRVSAAANAVVGGAQGVSLLVGGALVAVLSPRSIYAIAGLFGLTATAAIALFNVSPVARTGQLLPRWSEHRSTGPGRPRLPSP